MFSIHTSLKRTVLFEVAIKNSILLGVFILFCIPKISYEFELLEMNQQSGVLSILGFLMAGGIIGAFELSYTRTNMKSVLQRYLAHISKFLLYLATCILVWIGYKTIAITGAFYNDWILIASLLILSALFIFDMWDCVVSIEMQ